MWSTFITAEGRSAAVDWASVMGIVETVDGRCDVILQGGYVVPSSRSFSEMCTLRDEHLSKSESDRHALALAGPRKRPEAAPNRRASLRDRAVLRGRAVDFSGYAYSRTSSDAVPIASVQDSAGSRHRPVPRDRSGGWSDAVGEVARSGSAVGE
jgi:hypothetical protein